jgi:hypothetical protein
MSYSDLTDICVNIIKINTTTTKETLERGF